MRIAFYLPGHVPSQLLGDGDGASVSIGKKGGTWNDKKGKGNNPAIVMYGLIKHYSI